MKIREEQITLQDGKKLTLRTPNEQDGQAMLDYLYRVAEETHFLSRYPEEIQGDAEYEGSLLRQAAESDRTVFFTLFDTEKVIGNASIGVCRPHIKLEHRCQIGLAIRQEYWGRGLGKLLMDKAVAKARELGFVQMELGVLGDNDRAISLYKRMGFQEYGRLPRAYRLKDGTYVDEVMMVLFLLSD